MSHVAQVVAAACVLAAAAPIVWPGELVQRAQAFRAALEAQAASATGKALARCFKSARTADVAAILGTLVALGQAHELADGRFAK